MRMLMSCSVPLFRQRTDTLVRRQLSKSDITMPDADAPSGVRRVDGQRTRRRGAPGSDGEMALAALNLRAVLLEKVIPSVRPERLHVRRTCSQAARCILIFTKESARVRVSLFVHRHNGSVRYFDACQSRTQASDPERRPRTQKRRTRAKNREEGSPSVHRKSVCPIRN